MFFASWLRTPAVRTHIRGDLPSHVETLRVSVSTRLPCLPNLLKVVHRKLESAQYLQSTHLDVLALYEARVGLGLHEPRHGAGYAVCEVADVSDAHELDASVDEPQAMPSSWSPDHVVTVVGVA